MQRCITAILTAAVLMHATLGCCFHHSHACQSVGAEMHAAHAGFCSQHGAHAHAHGVVPENSASEPVGESGENHPRPGDDSTGCEGGDCSFARTESSDYRQALSDPCLGAACLLVVDETVGRTDQFRGASPVPRGLYVKLRPHLQWAVLLI